MKEWYREAFGVQYQNLYAHRDEGEARQTVELISSVTGIGPGMKVLDAPCGAGRHSRAFCRRGYRVFSLDLSRELLEAGYSQGGEGLPTYMRADLRSIPVAGGTFSLVVNLFSSFGYFESDEENMSVLGEFARVCSPGGWVVLDFLNSARVRNELSPRTERLTPEGWRVVEQRAIRGEKPRVEKSVKVVDGAGKSMEWSESVRLFTPGELAEGLAAFGWKVHFMAGDYMGQPLEQNSPRAILFARLTG
ncbi:MAG: class I SAM-dependent methyltransferase [Candidatus Sumerlaeaceae bacterium]|nr:class I SAM-dependent methyltransferase [Candidatus Sumerlaeaceae bacterium]